MFLIVSLTIDFALSPSRTHASRRVVFSGKRGRGRARIFFFFLPHAADANVCLCVILLTRRLITATTNNVYARREGPHAYHIISYRRREREIRNLTTQGMRERAIGSLSRVVTDVLLCAL